MNYKEKRGYRLCQERKTIHGGLIRQTRYNKLSGKQKLDHFIKYFGFDPVFFWKRIRMKRS